jgi:hypothetical protein
MPVINYSSGNKIIDKTNLFNGINMEIKHNSVLKRASHLWKQFDGGTVLVKHLKTMDRYYLNPVLAKVWLCIDGKRSVEEIFEAMENNGLQLSNENKEQLLVFLSELYQKNLLDNPGTMWLSK